MYLDNQVAHYIEMTLKNILLFGLLATILSCGIQKELQSDTEIYLPKEFYKRWKLDYGTMNGKRVSGLPPSPEQDFLFNIDF